MKIQVLMPDDVIRGQFLTKANVRALEALGDVTWNPSGEQYLSEELPELLKDTDIAILGWGCPRIGEKTLPFDSKLRLIVHTGGTIAPYVDDTVFSRGIKIITANEMYAESVAEGAIAYMLAALRRIPFWNNEVQSGRWRTDDAQNKGLLGRNVGITGFGAVAKHAVRLLKPFNVNIKVFADYLTDVDCTRHGIIKSSLDEVFSTCSVISIHDSLTPETYHIINADILSKVQDGSVLINTARGGIIDQSALTAELKTGRFSAVLDVFETEPIEPESGLRGLQNVILIPHMAGPTFDRHEAIGLELIHEIESFSAGRPLRYEVTAEMAKRMTAKG